MSLSNAEPPSLVVSITEDGIAILEMNRPKKRNALSQALIDELTAALRQIDRNPTVFAAILTSSGPFCGMLISTLGVFILDIDMPISWRRSY
jgi:enoyl-CoA hydratase